MSSPDKPAEEYTLQDKLEAMANRLSAHELRMFGNEWGGLPTIAREALTEIERLQAIIDRDIETLTLIAGSADRLIALHAATRLTNIGAKVP